MRLTTKICFISLLAIFAASAYAPAKTTQYTDEDDGSYYAKPVKKKKRAAVAEEETYRPAKKKKSQPRYSEDEEEDYAPPKKKRKAKPADYDTDEEDYRPAKKKKEAAYAEEEDAQDYTPPKKKRRAAAQDYDEDEESYIPAKKKRNAVQDYDDEDQEYAPPKKKRAAKTYDYDEDETEYRPAKKKIQKPAYDEEENEADEEYTRPKRKKRIRLSEDEEDYSSYRRKTYRAGRFDERLGSYYLWSARTAPEGTFIFCPALSYSWGSNETTTTSSLAQAKSEIKSTYVIAQFFMHYGVTDRFELNFVPRFDSISTKTKVSVTYPAYPQLNSSSETSDSASGLNDIPLVARYKFLDEREKPILTGVAGIYLPVGADEVGGGYFRHGYGLQATYPVQDMNLHANLSYTFLTEKDSYKPGNQLKYGLVGEISPAAAAGFTFLAGLQGTSTGDASASGTTVSGTSSSHLSAEASASYYHTRDAQFQILISKVISGDDEVSDYLGNAVSARGMFRFDNFAELFRK